MTSRRRTISRFLRSHRVVVGAVATLTILGACARDDTAGDTTITITTTPPDTTSIAEPDATGDVHTAAETGGSAPVTTAATTEVTAATTVPDPPDDSDSAFAAAVTAEPIAATPLWNDDAPVRSPIASGDGWIVVAADLDGERHTVVLDRATGETMWTRPASYSSIFAGYQPSAPLIIDDSIIHLDEYDGDDADTSSSFELVDVVALDPLTGEERWVADTPIAITSALVECDNGNVCGAAFLQYANERSSIEIDMETGRMTSTSQSGEPLSGGVVMDRTGERDDDRFIRRDGVDEVWSTTMDEAFGFDVDSRRGFSSFLHGDSGTWIVYVPAATGDLADDAVLGLDHDTGERRWIAPGVGMDCWGSFSVDGNAWCAQAGSYEVDWNGSQGRITSYTEITTRLEVFDPATGEPLGHVDLPTVPGWDGTGEWPMPETEAWFIDNGVIVEADDGLVALDTTTGAVATPADELLVWCQSPETDDRGPDGLPFFTGYHPCVVGDPTRAVAADGQLPGAWLEDAGSIEDGIAVAVVDGHVAAWSVEEGS